MGMFYYLKISYLAIHNCNAVWKVCTSALMKDNKGCHWQNLGISDILGEDL